jgi:hypothetical protein
MIHDLRRPACALQPFTAPGSTSFQPMRSVPLNRETKPGSGFQSSARMTALAGRCGR